MKLIVGLGNPGKEYVNTRHNIGFTILNYYCQKKDLIWKNGHLGEYTKLNCNNYNAILYKPNTFMNLSGLGVAAIANYFNISVNDIFVIFDDINFPISKIKIKSSGSSGGHNGIKNIIETLKTQNFSRMKVGIGKPENNLSKYVLDNFSKEEMQLLNNLLPVTVSIIDDYIQDKSIDNIMNIYNAK